MSDYTDGDVLGYTPEDRHCREGQAVVVNGRVLDTFWSLGTETHHLTVEELESAILRFNTGDYDELDQYARESPAKWLTFDPKDREQITSQHGLQSRWFIRKGAEPSVETMRSNIVAELDEAIRAAESATRRVEWKREDLARFDAERAAVTA